MEMTREAARRRLVVALDSSERENLLGVARHLVGAVGMVKLGLEAFTAGGPTLVHEVQDLGVPVFLDLKLHDIPNTVERAAQNCARLGVQALTVHAGGGEAMLAAAVRGASGGAAGQEPPLVLAVTVLTSLDQAALAALDLPGTAAQRAQAWAALARRAGCGGMVCSAQEVGELRRSLGPEPVLVTPGIRPRGGDAADQRRVASAAEAIAAGANWLVVGRPITAAPDPRVAAEAILDEIAAALT
jgi:orotidine-5'-phosphate decarboxylase